MSMPAKSDQDGPAWNEPPRRQARPRRAGRRGPHRRLLLRISGWVSVVVVAALTVGALAGYVKYRTIWDSISKFTVSDLGTRPPVYNSALNILVFGTDSRAG